MDTEKSELPSNPMSAGANAMSSQFGIIKDVLEQGIRRVTVTVSWVEGRKSQDVTVITYFTDPRKVDPPNPLPCDPDLVHGLAHVATRLSDLGDTLSKQIINWGYAVADRTTRQLIIPCALIPTTTDVTVRLRVAEVRFLGGTPGRRLAVQLAVTPAGELVIARARGAVAG